MIPRRHAQGLGDDAGDADRQAARVQRVVEVDDLVGVADGQRGDDRGDHRLGLRGHLTEELREDLDDLLLAREGRRDRVGDERLDVTGDLVDDRGDRLDERVVLRAGERQRLRGGNAFGPGAGRVGHLARGPRSGG